MGAALNKFLKWDNSQSITDMERPDPSKPKEQGKTRIVCVSDTHSQYDHENFPIIPDGDVLVHSGDFSNHGTPEEIEKFNAWLGTLPHKHKIVIAGNHDKSLDATFRNNTVESAKEAQEMLTNATHYLQDSMVELDHLKFYGAPWVPNCGNWGFCRDENQRKEKWSKMPDKIDVLITHAPPFGIGDLASDYNGAHLGCKHLLTKVKELKPKLHVYGHIHEAGGVRTDGTTIFANAGIMSRWHRKGMAFNPPIVIDL